MGVSRIRRAQTIFGRPPAQHVPRIRDRTEVLQLFRIHYRPYGLHHPVRDVERERAEDPAVWGTRPGTRLAVDFNKLQREPGTKPVRNP
jgi:hypothetical protein